MPLTLSTREKQKPQVDPQLGTSEPNQLNPCEFSNPLNTALNLSCTLHTTDWEYVLLTTFPTE